MASTIKTQDPLPNFMKSTISSGAKRKKYLQVSPNGIQASSSIKKPSPFQNARNSNHSKPCSASETKKPVKKPSPKTPNFMKPESPDKSLCSILNAGTAICCSSNLKGSIRFLDILMPSPGLSTGLGGTENDAGKVQGCLPDELSCSGISFEDESINQSKNPDEEMDAPRLDQPHWPVTEEDEKEMEGETIAETEVGGWKNAEELMLDHAIIQAVTKLAPANKRKVALLVKAFETVLPSPKCETCLPNRSSNTRPPIQACIL